MSFFKSLIASILKFLRSRPANPVDSTPASGETIQAFNERRARAKGDGSDTSVSREAERNYAAGEKMEGGEDDNIA